MALTNAGTKAAMDEMQYGKIELLSSLAGVAPPPTDEINIVPNLIGKVIEIPNDNISVQPALILLGYWWIPST